MAGRFEVVVRLVIVATPFMGATTAATHNVGDDSGWQVPKGGAVQYEARAGRTDIRVGDTIVFKWTGKGCSQVVKADFDNCEFTEILSPVQLSNPTNYTLISNNTQYFIGNANNCKLGQMAAITAKHVGDSASASAPSLLKGALSAIFMALAVSFAIHT